MAKAVPEWGGWPHTQEADETKKWRQQNSARMPAARRPRTPPRGSSPPPTASGGNQTRPGGQNPTRAAKRPQLEQRDTAKKAAQGPRRLFWRTRAAQAWHPQNRALRGANFSTTALPSTGGGQFHDHRARWFSLVASGQVELQETTELRNRKESYSLNDLFTVDARPIWAIDLIWAAELAQTL